MYQSNCSTIKGDYKCVRSYSPCLTGVSRILFNLITRNFNNQFNNVVCGTEEGRQEFVTHISCGDDVIVKVFHQTVHKLTLMLGYLQRNETADNQLPGMCCAFAYFTQYASNVIDEHCRNRTGPETSKYVVNLMYSIVSDAVDLACGAHTTVEICDSKEPRMMASFRVIERLEFVDKFGSTPVIPLVQIVNGLQ